MEVTKKITEDLSMERFDKACALIFNDYSRSQLKKWIIEGRVLLNNEIASPKEIIKLILPSFFKSIIWDTFSEEVIIAFALQSFTTYFISFGVNIVFTGFITAPTLAMPK